MVRETLQWMKVRALSTEHKLTPGALLPAANQVPFAVEGGGLRPRIPTGEYRAPRSLRIPTGEGVFLDVEDAGNVNVGADGVGIREITRRYRIQE
jgi:hypothetical protein